MSNIPVSSIDPGWLFSLVEAVGRLYNQLWDWHTAAESAEGGSAGSEDTKTDNTEKMSEKERDEKILEFFRNVLKTYDVKNDGTIASAELANILAALSRPSDTESVAILVKRFDPNKSGKIAWNSEELLLLIALMDVEDVKKIEDSIFSVGFNTFDQVSIF